MNKGYVSLQSNTLKIRSVWKGRPYPHELVLASRADETDAADATQLIAATLAFRILHRFVWVIETSHSLVLSHFTDLWTWEFRRLRHLT